MDLQISLDRINNRIKFEDTSSSDMYYVKKHRETERKLSEIGHYVTFYNECRLTHTIIW